MKYTPAGHAPGVAMFSDGAARYDTRMDQVIVDIVDYVRGYAA